MGKSGVPGLSGEPRIISRQSGFGGCVNLRGLSGLTVVNDNVSVPRGHPLRLRVVLLAGSLAAVAAGQDAPPPPTPCSPDAAPATPEPRDVLVASDVSAASRDESRAGDLLAAAAERGTVTLWPLDWLILARRDEARGDFTTAAARYRRYQASLEGSGEDTRWVEPRVKLLELASRAATASGSAGALPDARLALADARAALSRGDPKAAREKLGYAMQAAQKSPTLRSSVSVAPGAESLPAAAFSATLRRLARLVSSRMEKEPQ